MTQRPNIYRNLNESFASGSLVDIFEGPDTLNETEFEASLWQRVQSLADKDALWFVSPIDDRISDNPDDPHFSLSFGGEGFFVVGLHSGASRPARRFERPALVFNLHDQFEQLRIQNRYEKLRSSILTRDMVKHPRRHNTAAGSSMPNGDAPTPGAPSFWIWPTPSATTIWRRRVLHVVEPRSGVAFALDPGQRLTVIDPCGEQVADLLAFARDDTDEVISSGRTLDYLSRIYLTVPDPIYSNRSNIPLRIIADTVGRHDFLLTQCSKDAFRIIYGDTDSHPGCFGNLAAALAPWGIVPDRIPVAFNLFMNVPVDGTTGELRVLPPLSKAGDHIILEAKTDLIIGLTACSALQSNNGSFKPTHYRID